MTYAPCPSTTGSAASSASSTRASNVSWSGPAVSAEITGHLALAISAATFSMSAAVGCIFGAGGTLRSASGLSQSCSIVSIETQRYVGPFGMRCASSPARITVW